MNIELVRFIHFHELEEMIRSVPLVKPDEDGNQIFVYENAEITYRNMSVDDVNPTTFYLLSEGMETQRQLNKVMKEKYDLNTLRLNGAVEIHNEDTDELWTLTPPIVEMARRSVTFSPGPGEVAYDDSVPVLIPIINDGAHRVALARELGERFECVWISNIPDEHPFYAHPNEWDRVNVVDEVPANSADKKFYLREDNYALYRNFDVLGCGKPRSPGGD